MGGDTNLYGYCLNDPVNFFDSKGFFTEIVFWEPGQGKSRWGHIIVRIDNMAYSFLPDPFQMVIIPFEKYLKLERDRYGIGLVINLSPCEEESLKNFLDEYKKKYDPLFNNCTTPFQTWLKNNKIDLNLGYIGTPSDLWKALFEYNLQNNIINQMNIYRPW